MGETLMDTLGGQVAEAVEPGSSEPSAEVEPTEVEPTEVEPSTAVLEAEPSAEAAVVLPCPECEKQGVERLFGSNQALAVHRYRSHGVRGTSRNTRNGKSPAKEAPVQEQPKRQPKGETASPPRRRRRRRKATPVAAVQAVEQFPKDSVLKAVFPRGIAPTSEMLGRVQSWLSEGEELFVKAAPKNGKK